MVWKLHSGQENLAWEEFMVDMCFRFCDDLDSKLVEDFSRLQQLGSLDEYSVKFEKLKPLLLVRNPTIPSSYFLECFIVGLKHAIKSFGRLQEETTLA